MKRNNIIALVAVVAIAISCGDSTAEENTASAEKVTMQLDNEASTLWWNGGENENHFREGWITISEGSVNFTGDSIESGEFTIDMNSISSVDEGLPEEKIGYLNSHLKDTSFFQTYEFPTAQAIIYGQNGNNIDLGIKVMGVELRNEVPVTVSKDENGAKIIGEFSIDFSDTGMEYITKINPEKGTTGAKPVFNFKLNLAVKK